MWILTVDGLVSEIEEQRAGEHQGQIVVRAREKSALDALREVAPTANALRRERAAGEGGAGRGAMPSVGCFE
jgi:hypothetical protein